MGETREERRKDTKGADSVFMKKAEGLKQALSVVTTEPGKLLQLFLPAELQEVLGRCRPEPDWFLFEDTAQA